MDEKKTGKSRKTSAPTITHRLIPGVNHSSSRDADPRGKPATLAQQFHGFYRNPVFEIALPAIHEKFLQNPGVSFQEDTKFRLGGLMEDSRWNFAGFIFEANGAGFNG